MKTTLTMLLILIFLAFALNGPAWGKTNSGAGHSGGPRGMVDDPEPVDVARTSLVELVNQVWARDGYCIAGLVPLEWAGEGTVLRPPFDVDPGEWITDNELEAGRPVFWYVPASSPYVCGDSNYECWQNFDAVCRDHGHCGAKDYDSTEVYLTEVDLQGCQNCAGPCKCHGAWGFITCCGRRVLGSRFAPDGP